MAWQPAWCFLLSFTLTDGSCSTDMIILWLLSETQYQTFLAVRAYNTRITTRSKEATVRQSTLLPPSSVSPVAECRSLVAEFGHSDSAVVKLVC